MRGYTGITKANRLENAAPRRAQLKQIESHRKAPVCQTVSLTNGGFRLSKKSETVKISFLRAKRGMGGGSGCKQ